MADPPARYKLAGTLTKPSILARARWRGYPELSIPEPFERYRPETDDWVGDDDVAQWLLKGDLMFNDLPLVDVELVKARMRVLRRGHVAPAP